jgi:hypothetical protein
MTSPRQRVIYPARRAVEHAVATPGLRPLRLFPVLWPLWQVEIVAQVEDPQAYEVLDRFIERAVAECGLSAIDEIADFLGLTTTMINNCVRYLITIGHVTLAGGTVTLTQRGQASLRAGKRYVSKESRQQLLIDRLAQCPLPRSHYEGSLTVLAEPRIDRDDLGDRTQFAPLFAGAPFREEIIQQLVNLPNRTQFNLPAQLSDVRVAAVQDAYLPVYLIETTEGVLAYTGVDDSRDTYFEDLCRRSTDVLEAVRAERAVDPATVWNAWLVEHHNGRGNLTQLPNGVWRATLPPGAFGDRPRLPISRLGSFELRQRLFLQLWCDDRTLRRRTVMERALGIAQTREITTQAALLTWAATIARQLEVDPVGVAEIRKHAEEAGQQDRLSRLDALEFLAHEPTCATPC